MFDDRVIKCENEDAWIEERRHGIGASDAAVILGVSTFSSPYKLWAEKVELVEPADLSDREWIEWGHRLEPVIARAFAERTDREVTMWPQFDIVRHLELGYMSCTPDAIQQPIEGRDGRGLVEIKNVNAFKIEEWEVEPPLQYQVQIQHQMEVTGLTWGTLVVLIGGQKLMWFNVGRNEDFIKAMLKAEAEFWQRVEGEDPPEIDGSKATAATIKALHPDDNGEAIALPADAIAWAERLDEVKDEIKDREEKKRLLESKIKSAIGANTYGRFADGSGFSYKTQKSKEYTVSEGKRRVLRRLKA